MYAVYRSIVMIMSIDLLPIGGSFARDHTYWHDEDTFFTGKTDLTDRRGMEKEWKGSNGFVYRGGIPPVP